MRTLRGTFQLDPRCRPEGRMTLLRHEFFWIIAQSMLDFVDPQGDVALPTARLFEQDTVVGGEGDIEGNNKDGAHTATTVPNEVTKPWCVVCRLKTGIVNDYKKLTLKGIRSNVGYCAKCKMCAHTVCVNDNCRKIFDIPEFKGKTCFDIMHSELGCELWSRNKSVGDKKSYTVKTNHPVYIELRSTHGKGPKKRTRQQAGSSNDESDTETENEATNLTEV